MEFHLELSWEKSLNFPISLLAKGDPFALMSVTEQSSRGCL